MNPCPNQAKNWRILLDPLGFTGERRAKLVGGNSLFAQPAKPNLIFKVRLSYNSKRKGCQLHKSYPNFRGCAKS